MIANLNKYVDHTLLRADATEKQITALCKEAAAHHFMSVCVNPYWVKTAAQCLAGTDVKTCTVIGFPLGASVTGIKVAEVRQAIEDGAEEVDMVINIGELKNGNYQAVKADIQSVTGAATGKALVKVIIETALLTDAEKIKACELAKEAGADFVKTSTGFSTGGATIADVALMRRTVGNEVGVKASGGIRSLEDALTLIEAGANRLGSSNGVVIMEKILS